MKKILIIGGTGFIGSNLVKKLILCDYGFVLNFNNLPSKKK